MFFLKGGVFSGSCNGERSRDVLKVALKQGDTAARNSKEFAD